MLVQALALSSFAVTFFFGGPAQTPTAILASLVGLGLGMAGLFIANQHRRGGMPWATTHHEHALRTIVIGAAVWTLGSLLSFFGPLAIGAIYVRMAVMLWVAVRAGVGLVLAIMRRPIWRPTGILF